MSSDDRLWFRRTLIFIAVVSTIRLLLLPAIALTPQDAYYWQYSRHLSLGYFDHPPIHAWTAFLTTSIFGDNPFAIRFGPWLYGVGLLLLLADLSRRIWDARTGFMATVAAGVTPLFTIGSSILTPDPPLLFFWTLAMNLAYRAVKEDKAPLMIAAGFSVGLAALSKYTAVFLGFGFIALFVFSKEARKQLSTPFPYLAAVAAFAAFLPQFIWNAQNDWASFAYQSTRRAGELTHLRLDLFAGSLGSQLAVVSPLLFGGIIWAFIKVLKKSFSKFRDNESIFIAAFGVPILAFFFIVSLKYWVKMNWMAPAYIAGSLAFVGLAVGNNRKSRFFKWSVGLAAIETILLYFVVLAPFVPLSGEAGYWLGWSEIAERVEMERAEMPDAFIAGWGYKVPSELAFYLRDKPQTHSNEIFCEGGLNYAYWTDKSSLVGRDCIFVADKREPFRWTELLDRAFERVEEQPSLTPMRAGKAITTFRIWRCFGYKGC